MTEGKRVGQAILALSIPNQIRLAAELLEEAATLGDKREKQLHATRTAHRILDRISTELGAVLARL